MRRLARALGHLFAKMGEVALNLWSPPPCDRARRALVEAEEHIEVWEPRGSLADALRADDVALLERDPAEFVRRTERAWLGYDPLRDPADYWDLPPTARGAGGASPAQVSSKPCAGCPRLWAKNN